MLTRDKGWIKPVLILTLLGWIPILGQIVMLGYALEWARLTAWGVDAAPKQRGIDYGKVLSTGGRAFLVTLSLGIVIAILLQIVFPGSLAWLLSAAYGGVASSIGSILTAVSGTTLSLVAIVASAFVGLFLQAAALRATLYDSFSAGWRLDRLFQMIGRDFGGFCKTWLIGFIGGIIQGAYGFVVGIITAVFAMGGVLGALASVSASGNYMTAEHFLFEQLFRMGAGPLLLLVLLLIGLSFIGGVIATTTTLITANAMGQWFCRFDVNRWGVSSDPLPEGVPHRTGAWDASGQMPPSAPEQPAPGAEARAATCEPPAAAACDAPAAEDCAPEPPCAPKTEVLRRDDPAIEPVVPLDVPVSASGDAAASESPVAGAQTANEPLASDLAAAEPVVAASDASAQPVAAASVASDSPEDTPVNEDSVAPEPSKKPIPLGPITPEAESEDAGSNGPIQA